MKDVIFECPGCRQLLEAPEDMAGMMVECPKCKAVIKVEPVGNSPDTPRKQAEPKPPPEKKADEEGLKGSTIRIDLPPNLGIPQAPVRKLTIRRKS